MYFLYTVFSVRIFLTHTKKKLL